MQKVPKGLRLHISVFGKRNVGKSSIINCLAGQQVSIVSEYAGTTTDPVEKPMEFFGIGPCVLIDTAGIDDIGALGAKRIEKSRKIIERTELALLAVEAGGPDELETKLLAEFAAAKIPTIVVCNKSDLGGDISAYERLSEENEVELCRVCALTDTGFDDLRAAIIKSAPAEFLQSDMIIRDLVPAGEAAVLVVPIDKEAPKGRLLLPQVQAIRDLLDGDSMAIVTQTERLKDTLSMLSKKPALVVTDSQAFEQVSRDTPEDVPLTSFSILFARFKGDLGELAKNTLAIENLKPGDKVMIAEACTHHPIEDDIGTVKIPRWLNKYAGGELVYDHWRSHDFPEDVSKYKLIVHCAACIWNKREVLCRLSKARATGVPMTNYGLTIAYCLGVFDRAIRPYEGVYAMVEDARGKIF